MDSSYKLYMEILENKLAKELEEKKGLENNQIGFRKERGTIDAIYVLKTVAREILRREKGKLCLFLADMKRTFDRLSRKAIWDMMKEIGISMKLRKRIKGIYENTRSEVKVKEERIGGFVTTEGVRQGCPLSPTIFNISILVLEKEMRKEQEGGVVIRRKKVVSLSYAEDKVLMATSQEGLKAVIKRFKKYLEKKGLELNVEK